MPGTTGEGRPTGRSTLPRGDTAVERAQRPMAAAKRRPTEMGRAIREEGTMAERDRDTTTRRATARNTAAPGKWTSTKSTPMTVRGERGML